jgi:hypothetical protein
MTNSTYPSASIRCRVRCCLARGSRRPSAIAAASPAGTFIQKMPRASGVLHQDAAEHRPGTQRHPACPAPDARCPRPCPCRRFGVPVSSERERDRYHGLGTAAAGDPAAAIRRAMREAEPAQPTAAHRTGSYALASGLH